MKHRPPVRSLVVLEVAALLVACSNNDDPKAVEVGVDGVGWCLDVPDDVGPEINQISDLPRVECDQLHTHEIFAVANSTSDAYPGFEALETEAQVACLKAFEGYVGMSPFDSNLFYSWIVPTLASWEDETIKRGDQHGDREIICVAGLSGGAKLTESIEQSGR